MQRSGGHPTTPEAENGLQRVGRHDPSRARKAQRAGREKGIRLYISASELRAAGIDPDAAAPTFRVWSSGRGRGSLLIRLYAD